MFLRPKKPKRSASTAGGFFSAGLSDGPQALAIFSCAAHPKRERGHAILQGMQCSAIGNDEGFLEIHVCQVCAPSSLETKACRTPFQALRCWLGVGGHDCDFRAASLARLLNHKWEGPVGL